MSHRVAEKIVMVVHGSHGSYGSHDSYGSHGSHGSHGSYGSHGSHGSYGSFVSVVKNPFGEKIGQGTANSRTKSEQLASEQALITLGVIVNGEINPNWIDTIEKVEKEEKKKEKTDKKSMSVFNPNNKLMKKMDIINMLSQYNVCVDKNSKSISNFFMKP